MDNTFDKALVGTDAIKAFVSNFGPMEDQVNKIILEELLKCLLNFNEERDNVKRIN